MKTAQRGLWYLGLATIVAVVAGLGTTHAQQGAIGANNPWLTLLPALRTAPAPGWLRPGMRLTYYSAFARIQQDRERWIKDETCNPNNPNGAIDPDNCVLGDDRQWYRRHPEGAPGSITGEAASGHGFTEVNVLALDQTVAVLDARSLNLSDATGPPITLANWGSLELPAAGGDWWLNPQVLRGAAGLSAGPLTVMPIPYAITGRRYNALWFTLNSAGRHVHVYDLDTGVLLHTSTEDKAEPTVIRPGASQGAATLLSQNTLLGTRTPAFPWARYPAPDWVRQVAVLRYEGGTTSEMAGTGMIPASAIFERQAVGATWALYLVTIPQTDPTGGPTSPTQISRAFGSAQFGGLWIHPQGLAQLQQGQVLDDDPITKFRVLVRFVGRTPQGADVVVIAEDGAGQLTETVYDRASGGLLYYSFTNKILRTRTQLQLTQRR